MPNHPAPPLVISEAERRALRSLSRAGRTEQRLATRARIVLRAADGVANERIAADPRVDKMTVLLWRRRFEAGRLGGLRDAPRPGREPIYTRAERDRVIARRLEPPPEGVTHWSARRMAKEVGMSITTVQRIWAEASLKPHRTETLKWSTDPELVTKVHDVVGLYLDAPQRAVVLSVDEKTQIQALDRTQPMLPLRPGQVERHTHDYKRNGPTDLFAALNVATGEVTHEARQPHRHRLPGLPAADRAGLSRRRAPRHPRQSRHPQDARRARLARAPSPDPLPLHPDLGVRAQPGIETCVSILSRQAIRRGAFRSVKELVVKIDEFTRIWNAGASPFMWVKTADEILAKAVRKPRASSESVH